MQGLSFGRGAFRAVCIVFGESVWEETTGEWSDFFFAVQFSCFCRFSLALWQKVHYGGEGILDRSQRHRTPVCVLSFVDRNFSMRTKLVVIQYLSVNGRKPCISCFFFRGNSIWHPSKNLVREDVNIKCQFSAMESSPEEAGSGLMWEKPSAKSLDFEQRLYMTFMDISRPIGRIWFLAPHNFLKTSWKQLLWALRHGSNSKAEPGTPKNPTRRDDPGCGWAELKLDKPWILTVCHCNDHR